MSTISKRGEGRDAVYVARWRTPAGQSRQKTLSRQKDAQAFLDTVTSHVQAGQYVDAWAERVRFGVWADEWSEGRLNLRDSTRTRNESIMRLHVLTAFAELPLGAITQPAVQKWVRGLCESGLSAATVQIAYQQLSGSLAAAVRAKHLRTSPCVGIELPKVEKEDQRFLDHADVSRLAASVPDRYRALVLLLAYGGLRIGEATGLRRHRINLLKGTVTVATTATEVRGRWVEQRPKTDAGRRTVPIPAGVVTALREHLEAYSQPEADGLVFTASEGGALRVNTFRRRVWGPAVKAAGLEPLRIHDLRHTAVSLWISAGADLLHVKKWAGHTRSTFTLDRYGHLYDDDATVLLGRLDDAITLHHHKDAAVVPFGVAGVLEG